MMLRMTGGEEMSRRSRFGSCALAAGFMLMTGAGVAAEVGSLSYPPQAVFPFGSATVSSVIDIPKQDPGVAGFFLNFVLPADYSTNEKVRISVYFTTSAAKPCSIVFRRQTFARWRPGVAPSIFSTGLNPTDGSDIVAFSDSRVVQKAFTMKRDPAFTGGQRPGDAIRIGLGREGTEPGDTCNGAVQIPAIDIRYPRVP
jgi:hypothetical protein